MCERRRRRPQSREAGGRQRDKQRPGEEGGDGGSDRPPGTNLLPDHQLSTPITIDQAIKCAFLQNDPLD